ncbi:DUF3140 domain-containing protein [Nonomuraea roseoviolacea subsp. roseoviolacea]|uniref:DUF3140 domain-containing protein n=1 Tax=Nonomuraea roseoviolacea subsp. carminata TaxID=160689 RepID=A0ABT1K375_9ACTN|nr:DUF3140 domain-containing protein [Nonomuraea roseoviolacea]MCP2348099.1 hypothetical protein [Nonomuraea roseoviolacea subsp. carminata]
MSVDSENYDADLLWEEFHGVVNMTSEELRAHLLADAAEEDVTLPSRSDLGLDELGRGVLHVLAKRKTDLTKDDLDTMRQVVELVETLDNRTDDEARRVQLSVGHDPLRAT